MLDRWGQSPTAEYNRGAEFYSALTELTWKFQRFLVTNTRGDGIYYKLNLQLYVLIFSCKCYEYICHTINK